MEISNVDGETESPSCKKQAKIEALKKRGIPIIDPIKNFFLERDPTEREYRVR